MFSQCHTTTGCVIHLISSAFQSTDFRERALATQTQVRNIESKIKSAFQKTLLKADAQGAFTFDEEVALDSLISVRSLVISSLLSVRVCIFASATACSHSFTHPVSQPVNHRSSQAAPPDSLRSMAPVLSKHGVHCH